MAGIPLGPAGMTALWLAVLALGLGAVARRTARELARDDAFPCAEARRPRAAGRTRLGAPPAIGPGARRRARQGGDDA